MGNPNLDRLFHQFFEAAKQNLVKDGFVAPFVFLLSGSHEEPELVQALPLRFANDSEKTELAGQIETLIRHTGAWGYITVCEAWVLDREDFDERGFPPEARPSEHARRREAVWVALFAYDHHRGAAAIFERREDGIVFQKEIPMEPDDSFAGRFADLLPPMS